jgi:hypothetical protein
MLCRYSEPRGIGKDHRYPPGGIEMRESEAGEGVESVCGSGRAARDVDGADEKHAVVILKRS